MSAKMQAPKGVEIKPFRVEGTASHIGSSVFIGLMLPVVREATSMMEPDDVALLYGVMIGALYGALCGDFGPEQGPKVFRLFTEKMLALPAMETTQ